MPQSSTNGHEATNGDQQRSPTITTELSYFTFIYNLTNKQNCMPELFVVLSGIVAEVTPYRPAK